MDINIVDPCAEQLGQVKSSSCQKGGMNSIFTYAKGQNLNFAAVKEQCTKQFLVDVPGISPTNGAPSSAPANSSTPTSSPTPTGCGGGVNGTSNQVKTETVYSDTKTVTVTVTANPSGDANPQLATGTAVEESSLATASTPCTRRPTVTPFFINSRPHGRAGLNRGFNH